MVESKFYVFLLLLLLLHFTLIFSPIHSRLQSHTHTLTSMCMKSCTCARVYCHADLICFTCFPFFCWWLLKLMLFIMSKWRDRENKLLARLPHTQTNPNGSEPNRRINHKWIPNTQIFVQYGIGISIGFSNQNLIIYAEQMLSNRPQQNYVWDLFIYEWPLSFWRMFLFRYYVLSLSVCKFNRNWICLVSKPWTLTDWNIHTA